VPYFQIFNEPGDGREFFDTPEQFANLWTPRAEIVAAEGGYPGLQVLGEEYLAAVAGGISPLVRERLFFSLHNYGANHPPNYPYDDVNQQGTQLTQAQYDEQGFNVPMDEVNTLRHNTTFVGSPHDPPHKGQTIYQDDTSVLRFLAIAEWCQRLLGFVPPMIGSEGGWLFRNRDDMRYPPCHIEQWIAWHHSMFEWFRTGVISTGDALPDYLFSITPWLVYGAKWTSDSWVFGLHYTADEDFALPDENPSMHKIDLIEKLESDAPYVRMFGAAGQPAPAPQPQPQPEPNPILVPKPEAPPVPNPNPIPNPENVIVHTPPTVYDFTLMIRQGTQARVKQVYVYGEDKAQERHLAYGRVQNRSGIWLDYERIEWNTLFDDGSVDETTRASDWTINGQVNFEIHGGFDPNKKPRGPYQMNYLDAGVDGMGNPNNRHYQFLVVFEKQ
jgi:hypothetical protein